MIDLHSVIDKWPGWDKEHFSKSKAFVDLVYLANQKPEHSVNVRNVWTTVLAGQLGWSIVKLSERWKWSRNKVIRYLAELEEAGLITQVADNVTTIITIVDYHSFLDKPLPDINTIVVKTTSNGTFVKQTTRSVKDLIVFKNQPHESN